MPTMKFTTAKDKNNNNQNNRNSTIIMKTAPIDTTTWGNITTSTNTIITNSIITNNNTLNKLLKCTLCNFTCLYSSQMVQHYNLKNHTRNIYENPQIAQKDILPEDKPVAFKRKVETININGSKRTKLEISSALSPVSISSNSFLNSSMISEKKLSGTEASVTPQVYCCKECEYNNPIKKNYERHMWCHTSDFPFKCKHCSFSSNAENAVQRHITQYHTAIKKSLMNALKDQDNFKNSKNTNSNIRNHTSEKTNNSHVTKLNGLGSVATPLLAASVKSMKKEAPLAGNLLKCIIIKTRTKEKLTSWTCHSCDVTSSSSSTMNEHTTSTHNTALEECVTIIQDYYIINGAEPKVVQRSSEEVACAHCGFDAPSMDAMRIHLREDCHGLEGGKGDESGEEGEQRSLSLVFEKSESDAKGKGPLGKFSKALNDMMDKFTLFYGSSSKKLYLVCFMCKYKTYSMKVLKKHLIKEHAEIITNHKELNSLSRKCLFYSLKQECKQIDKIILYKNKQKKEQLRTGTEDDGVGEEEGEEEDGEDASLRMEVTTISTNQDVTPNQVLGSKDSKSPNTYKREILETFKHEGELNKVFECSVCAKKVFFKCNLKKHVESTHPKAKIIQLSILDGTLSQDDLIKFHKKHRVNKLKKLLSKKGISKNELNAMNSLISDELEGQSLEFVLDRSETNGDEKVGMIDSLRLKRFQCGVCLFRSNFRSDISRHLKVKHPNRTNSYYTVLSIEEATHSLEMYKNARPNIDMRYTKQRNTSFTLLPGKNMSNQEADSSFGNDIETNETTKTGIASAPAYNQLPIRPSSSSYELQAFYQSLPYSLRRLNQLEDLLKCNICPFYTFKPTSFKVHRSCHQTVNRANQLSCPHCPFFVSTKRLYEKHLQLHTQFALAQAARMFNYAFKSGNNNVYSSSININTNYGENSNNFNADYISDYLLYCHQNYKSAHLRFCQYKYICPECPFKTDRREDFWCHGKFHFEGKDRSSEFKCDQCSFYATDKRGLIQHSTLHNKGYTPKAKLEQSDLVRGEFCRCDLADFLKDSDLACFKQLSCTYCSYSNNSVKLLRQHIASHVPLTNCYTTQIFSTDLDTADDLLNILCTRLLNMNYCLVEEAHKKVNEEEVDEEACNNEMPILEKFTDLPSPELYNPDQSISVSSDQLPLKPPIKVINLYNNSLKHLNAADNKTQKIIKITSHISTNILTSPCLPALNPSIPPAMLSPPMPMLKLSNSPMEIKEEIKGETHETTLPAKSSEWVELSMQTKFLSAPEEVFSEGAEGLASCENDSFEAEYIEGDQKRNEDDIMNDEEENNSSENDIVWKDECVSAKRIFMLSLGLVEIINI